MSGNYQPNRIRLPGDTWHFIAGVGSKAVIEGEIAFPGHAVDADDGPRSEKVLREILKRTRNR